MHIVFGPFANLEYKEAFDYYEVEELGLGEKFRSAVQVAIDTRRSARRCDLVCVGSSCDGSRRDDTLRTSLWRTATADRTTG